MKLWMVCLLLLFAGAAGAGGGYWFAHRPAGEKPEQAGESDKPEETPVAKVSVAPIRRGSIAEEISGYGTIIAPASEVRVVSVSFESRITKILVTPGQTVKAAQPLIEVAGSAATALLVEEAKTTFSSADRDFKSVKSRFDQNLATNAELNAAESALAIARGRLQNLQQSGAGAPAVLKAEADGIVSRIDTQVGQVVPVGGPLVEVAAQDKVETKLSVDPRYTSALKTGQEVELRRVDDDAGKPVKGSIRLIGRSVDPATHFVDVIVSIPTGDAFLLNGFVVAKLSVREVPDAMIVPRSAVLPGDDGDFEVFTIDDGKAVPHSVKVGIETDDESQIISDDLKEGQAVVIIGNNELEKGMQVTVEPVAKEAHEADAPQSQPAAAPPTSAPATSPAASAGHRNGSSL